MPDRNGRMVARTNAAARKRSCFACMLNSVHEVVPNADGRDLTTDNVVLEVPRKHNVVQTLTAKADV